MAFYPVRSAVAQIAAGAIEAVDVAEAAGEAAADEIVGGAEAVAVARVGAVVVEGVRAAAKIDVRVEVEAAMIEVVAEVTMVVTVKKHQKWSLQRNLERKPRPQVAIIQVQCPSRLHLQRSHLKRGLWWRKHCSLRDRQRHKLRSRRGCRVNRNRPLLSKRPPS